MPTIARAVVVHKHTNGLPRDSFVNTWHFGDDPVNAAGAENVAERVRDFYIRNIDPYATSLANMFGSQVALVGHEVRVYPVDVATGRDPRGEGFPPYWVETFDHISRTTQNDTALPSEVALCLSFRNNSAGAVPPARRRGRIFTGPWSEVNNASPSTPWRPTPSAQLLTMLRASAALTLADLRGGDWVIYSRPFAGRAEGEKLRADGTPLPAIPARTGATYPVESIWTDDAWDTQRRRGERAVNRTFA